MPSDPIDAVLRLAAVGARLGDELVRTIRDSIVEIGCDENDRPLLGAAPDGTPCVVVVTAELQKAHIDVDRWWPVHGGELAGLLPPGADVLLNPSGSAPLRLGANALRGGAPGDRS